MDHLANTKLALKYWLTIPEKNVSHNLDVWYDTKKRPKATCNTVACFGGWVALMPEFKEMGVRIGNVKVNDKFTFFYEPVFENTHGTDVAIDLFGHSGLFRWGGACDYDASAPKDCSDHELVTHRLREHIKYLESKGK